MAKIWRKKNGQWVKTTPDVTKEDIGLGNVANYPPTNSSTDGSSSKYATGAAVKEARDYIDSLGASRIPQAGTSHLRVEERYDLPRYDERVRTKNIFTFTTSGRCTVWMRGERGNGYGRFRIQKNGSTVADSGRRNMKNNMPKTISANIDFRAGDVVRMYIHVDDNRLSTTQRFTGRVYTGNSFL